MKTVLHAFTIIYQIIIYYAYFCTRTACFFVEDAFWIINFFGTINLLGNILLTISVKKCNAPSEIIRNMLMFKTISFYG